MLASVKVVPVETTMTVLAGKFVKVVVVVVVLAVLEIVIVLMVKDVTMVPVKEELHLPVTNVHQSAMTISDVGVPSDSIVEMTTVGIMILLKMTIKTVSIILLLPPGQRAPVVVHPPNAPVLLTVVVPLVAEVELIVLAVVKLVAK